MSSETLRTRNGTEGIELVDLLVNKKPMSRCEVIVNFSLDFNRKTSAAIEEKIEEIWEEKRKNNPRLFNGSKFRFAGVTTNSEAVVFNIGISSYKELMATNCHQYGRELIDYSVKNFCSSNSYMADALGIGSLLSTSDDKFLFIKRAMWTGEDVGKIDRAGGHPEPEKVAPDSQKQYTSLNSDAVRDEIFNSVLDEIVSEINLPLETLSDPLLLGTVRSMERLGRPTAEFLVKCSLTSKEVEKYYSRGTQAEADETVGIIFVAKDDLHRQELDANFWSNLTDSACGAIELFSRTVF